MQLLICTKNQTSNIVGGTSACWLPAFEIKPAKKIYSLGDHFYQTHLIT